MIGRFRSGWRKVTSFGSGRDDGEDELSGLLLLLLLERMDDDDDD